MNLQHKITELKEKKKIFSLLLMGISRQRWRKGYVRTYRLAEKKKKILVSLQMFSPPRWLLTLYLLMD